MDSHEINRVISQMMRGMGPESTPESRAAVNAETMARRAERAVEIRLENCVRYWSPVSVQAMTDAEFVRRMQSGEYGRLG